MSIKKTKIPAPLECIASEYPYIGSTSDIHDDVKGKTQREVNADVDSELALHQSEINGLDSQNYVTVSTYAALIAINPGSVDTIYRVSSWDGTQVDATKYAEYAWKVTGTNTGEYVLLDVKTQVGEVYDISEAHSGQYYEDLTAALGTNGENVPAGIRRGGMQVKFIQGTAQSSDNKYVQYRLMADTWSITASDWQGVDDEPTSGSNNLVKSGGVFNTIKESEIVDGSIDTKDELSFVDGDDNCIAQFKGGHIKTKNFDSRDSATKTYVDNKVSTEVTVGKEEVPEKVAEMDGYDRSGSSVSIIDEQDYCIVQFKEGHVKTKGFDSRTVVNEDNIEQSNNSLSFVDEDGNCIAQFKNGGIKTKNFDSENIEVNIPEIIIPDKIVAVVDDTLQIFYKAILNCPDYTQYGVVVNCNIGKSYPRYYEVKPVAADIGEKNLTILVYDNNIKVVKQKTIKLDVIAKATSPATNKNILLVAASTFAYGIIMPEVKRRLTLTSGSGTAVNPTGLGLSNISFIGRKTIEATSDLPAVKQEATGGYGWKTYATDAFKSHRFYVSGASAVTLGATYTIDGVPIPSGVGYLRVIEVNITDGTGNILCEVNGGAVYPQGSIPVSGTLIKRDGTGDASIAYSSTVEEDGNPFWYNGDLDFQHYSSACCNNADIDILITHIGLNGFTSIANVDTQIETYAKPFIRKYHEDYPNGKVILNTLQIGSPFGGYGSVGYASSTQNWYNISKIYWYALEKYKELSESAEFSPYVVLGNITPEFDCEFGYPTTNKAVNNRVATTESVQSNQIHPTDDGKLMLADSIYRDVTKVLSQI